MTDREMLMVSYGAMKALDDKWGSPGLNLVVKLIETHLSPPPPLFITATEIEQRNQKKRDYLK